MQPFDLLNAPLKGINLIEASAGTGKTYNIEGLFIRLVLELQIPIDRILVLTFTKAATEELKARIRHKLVLAKETFAGNQGDDPFISGLIKKYPDAQRAGRRLHEALIDFDQAAIFTIHGFCQRVLQENAFETNNLFDTELITNQNSLIQEVVDDFWRKTFYELPQELIGFCLNRNIGPEYFYALLGRVKRHGAKMIPTVAEADLAALAPYRSALSRLKDAWPPSRETVIQALNDPALSAVIYGSLKPAADYPEMTKRNLRLTPLIEAMDHLSDSLSVGFPLFDKFDRFTTTKLTGATKKNCTPPAHQFFNLCETLFTLHGQLHAQMENYLVALKVKFLDYADTELSKRKKAVNVQYFDDLLLTLLEALRSESGNALAKSIRQKYKAALVDEFQDTDGIQYGILSRLFSQDDSLLFMIGDPKQAIYSFRGADIFSYMDAAGRADAKFTLLQNWRSQPNLIAAVNTLFNRIRSPFIFNEIAFENSRSGRQPKDGNGEAGMTLWYLDADRFSSGDKPIRKTDAVHLAAAAVLVEIRRLLNDPAPVEPGKIAVLVRTNDQAQLIKNVLSSGNVPSVLYSTGNIFDSVEAYEIEKILLAITDPFHIPNLKAALATEMMGLTATDLVGEEVKSQGWQRRQARFGAYFHIWDRYGFVRMFQQLLVNEQVKSRLLSLPDGERRLTNVLHLADVLHHRSMDENAGMMDCLKWLAEQRDPATPRLEEYQLRLESDEKAVKIVTIHKSKGLEYPIVFCPFAWEKSLIRDKEFTFHNDDDDRRVTLELGSPSVDRHIAMAQNEILSENLRLLYVALTRAKAHCYLAWGRINSAETSALAYLLHYDDDIDVDSPAGLPSLDLIGRIKAQFMAKTNSDMLADIKKLAAKSQGSIRIQPLPVLSDQPNPTVAALTGESFLFARKFAGRIDHSWRTTSFSSLVSAAASDIDWPDRDPILNALQSDLAHPPGLPMPANDPQTESVFSFPKGTRAGTFFHDVLEHHDFTARDPETLSQLVADKLAQYGFDQKWRKTVCRSLSEVIAIPLHPDRPELTLSSVPMTDRANEMEFYFPLNQLSSASLPKIFKPYGWAEKLKDFAGRLAKLEFAPTRGFMKGYIDLVFRHLGRYYLVDWKSNDLGPDHEHYHHSALKRTMQTELYTLQYHLYTLALHQHLRLRVPHYRYEADFGGVFYIFLRGVDTARGSDYGIYYDLPAPDLIHSLGQKLIPGYEENED